MNIEMIKAHVRTIPDFPKPGILFRDITTVYKDAACLQELTNSLTDYYKDKGITKVLGIESRGYTMASILAQKLNAGFVFVRKPGIRLQAHRQHESGTRMTREEVFDGLKEIIGVIRPNTDLTNVGFQTELVRELGIDSLTMLLLSLAAEEKFGMHFPDGAPVPVTVGEVCDAVVKAKA